MGLLLLQNCPLLLWEPPEMSIASVTALTISQYLTNGIAFAESCVSRSCGDGSPEYRHIHIDRSSKNSSTYYLHLTVFYVYVRFMVFKLSGPINNGMLDATSKYSCTTNKFSYNSHENGCSNQFNAFLLQLVMQKLANVLRYMCLVFFAHL